MTTAEQDSAACRKKRHWQQRENADAAARRIQASRGGGALKESYRCAICGLWCISTPLDAKGESRKPKKPRGRAYRGSKKRSL